MALGKAGDVVSFTSAKDSATHYGIVLGTPDATHNRVAWGFGVSSNQLEWFYEENVAAVTVLSGTDALHG